ncbi:conserved hypothetical protein [Candidatus Terasakiella magnetica]|nr:conserved hypothetical protein [Candidatus Terasakiella magnetica]
MTAPMTIPAFQSWFADAVPGDGLIYHQGLLGIDRTRGPSSLPESARSQLDRVAARALVLAEDGAVLLVQRRVAEDRIAYIAIKASGGTPRRI